VKVLTRALAVIGLILLLAGLELYVVLGPLVCFQGCPRDVPGAVIGFELKALGPGLVVAIGAWFSGLIALARRRRWVVGAFALFAPPLLIAVGYIASPLFGLQAPIPGPAGQLSQILTIAALVMSGLMIVIGLLRYDSARGVAHPRDHASADEPQRVRRSVR
jgi:hypothetical protein